ncbi:pimeloyl-ACP methyl ester carboxylesterase [Kitasatospora sp. GP30]|uniref:alpha/beta hydrolase family protein n=1 Tax=Kitasatospora sp. GP30 TaxID=3035084 RepID=UPI000C71315A|nr:alpha/beta hydrolase [Kitasatospora sp. GP30]MDH6143756.1 pimeloyl-ACP methyl ester carboxylesterase [Kitasatospora sp. GP30]
MRWRTLATAALLAAVTATGLGAPTANAAAPAALVPAADRDVQFTVDGTTAYGTLHVPAHRAGHHLAAALLLPGSGPTDRDGNEPPALTPGTLALIADTLGADGVMTLRFDKYFTGRTGAGAYQGDPGRLDLAAFTRQATAAYTTLRDQPEADPHALLVVGHSEGGLQALLLARTVRPAPAGLALLAPQDERLLDLLAAQLDGQLDEAVTAGQLTEPVAQANRAGIATAIADFRAGRPTDTSALLPPLASLLNALFGPNNARFVRSDDAVSPPDAARAIRPGTRVTVTCGTADANVPCATTAPLLTALARAHATGPGLRTLDGLDHFLHPAGTPVNDRMLAPAAVAALHEFARPWKSGE